MSKKSILTYVLSFIMCISLAAAAIGAGGYFGFMSDDSLIMAFSEAQSFDGVREEILDGIDYSAIPYGMDRLGIEAVITKDMVRGDVSSYIYSRFNGIEFEVDKETFENSFYYTLMGMYAEKNIHITQETDRELDTYCKSLYEYYSGCIDSIELGTFLWLKKDYESLAVVAMVSGVVLGLLCLTGICFTERTRRDRCRFWSHGFTAGGIIAMLVPTFLLATREYLNLSMTTYMPSGSNYLNMSLNTEYMYNAGTTFMRNGFITVNFMGCILICAGIACAVADMIFLNNEKKV